MKKMLFIVNPMAGKSAYKNNFGEAMLVFDRAGIAPTVRFTSSAGDATELAKQAADYDIVGCVGGDGTLSEVMEGLVQLPKEDRRPIGYIPLGTANDVATTLGLPKNNIIAAAERIANGKPRYFDVGTFGDNGSFTYVAAFGAFTDVSYETPQQEKQALGHFAYVLEGMTRLPKITTYATRIDYDGGVIEDEFVFGGVMNSTSVAGLIHLDTNQIKLDDGLFELALVRKPKSLIDLHQIVMALINRNYNGAFIKFISTTQATFTFKEPVAWTRDGEDGGSYEKITFRNMEKAVEIIT